MAIVVVSADITAGAGVAVTTIANHVIGAWIQNTLVGVCMIRSDCVWTTARATTDFTAQQRVSVISFNTLIATVSGGGVAASQTLTTAWITMGGVTVALASLAIGEIPKTWLTLITLTAICIRMTFALSGVDVTFVVGCTDTVAIACFATLRAKAVGAGHTFVTLTTENVRFALTTAAKVYTFLAHRSGWIAIARFGAVVYEDAHVFEYFITFGRCPFLVVNIIISSIAIVGNVFLATIFSWR